ncbi:MAG: hypothetical protein MUQ30_10235, partial [Anaerolineae bacterium]|nr:hypothetical protein [Anaerolineae bacterium]
MPQTVWNPLSREDVIKAIERRNPSRIPLVRAKWWGEGLREQYGARLDELDRYPEDVVALWIQPLDFQAMDLSWDLDLRGAHDARVVVDDWSKLDEFIEKLPDPECDPQIDALKEEAERARAENRYVMF